jgi:hypothetical protein
MSVWEMAVEGDVVDAKEKIHFGVYILIQFSIIAVRQSFSISQNTTLCIDENVGTRKCDVSWAVTECQHLT